MEHPCTDPCCTDSKVMKQFNIEHCLNLLTENSDKTGMLLKSLDIKLSITNFNRQIIMNILCIKSKTAFMILEPDLYKLVDFFVRT